MPLASLGDDISSFFSAVGKFFSSLADIHFGSLLIALIAFGLYLTIRARAAFHILRAAYPRERIEFKRIWAAYIAAYGFNNVIPARGGDVIRLFLTKTSIPNSSYSAVAAATFVEVIFDATMGVFILTFAFTQGVFPKPPDFANLGAFDLSFFAGHPRFLLFVITVQAALGLAGFALLSRRVRAFWARVRQGLTILRDRRRYFREVWLVQLGGWCFRFTALWFLLEAFNIGGSVKHVLLVLGVNAVAAAVPFTPGGAGVQQAFLVKVFAGTASGATVAAYSVGQQIAIAAFTLAIGFVALATIFKFRSFKDVIAAGRADRAGTDPAAAEGATAAPAAPRAPA
ncbi:MAG: lysylphosphatidylglycerol synthase transmembrane domain-containing protein [Solirubrobacteraceae bacterium]